MNTVRIPPTNREAEEAVLGCMIQDPRSVETTLGICSADDFYTEANRAIFTAITNLYSSGSPVDILISLPGEMKRLGREVLPSALSDLIANSPAPATVEYYARLVAECSARRSMIAGVSGVVSDLYESGDLGDVAARLSEISLRPTNKTVNDTPDKYMPVHMGRLRETWSGSREKFIPSGFYPFDGSAGGFEVGGVTLVGGDSKTGKTTFLMHVAHNMAEAQRPVGFMEFDMQSSDIPLRWICSRSGYSWNRLHSHDKTQVEPTMIEKYAKEWEALPFYLAGQDEVGTDFEAILLMARRWKRLYGIRALFIDSIQSLRFSSVRGLEGEALVAAQMDAMVRLAVTLDIAVIAISEYSNNLEREPKFRFKGSGRVHYAASLGLALERPVDPETGERSDWLKVVSAWERNQPFCKFALRGGFNCFNLYAPEGAEVPSWVFGRKR